MKKLFNTLSAALALLAVSCVPAPALAQVTISDGAKSITIPAPTPPADLAPLTSRVGALETRDAAQNDRLAALEAAVKALQSAPPTEQPGEVVPPLVVALDPFTDPRTVTLLDGDKTPQQHPAYVGLQLADGLNTELRALSGSAKLHTKGACVGQVWFGREQRADGKWAYTARACKGQQTFQTNTVRAEWLAPDGGYPANLARNVDERGKTYWMAVDYVFDADVAENTGRQYGGGAQTAISGLHGNNWSTYLIDNGIDSNGHSFGSRVEGNVLNWRIHGPGEGPSPLFDVRTEPLSTKVVGQKEVGKDWGTAHHWQTWTIQPGVSVKYIGKLKFAKSAAGAPRTEIWRKVGDGPLVKIIDSTQPNTFSDGFRYWKTGIYTWDLGDAWWGNKSTRTMRIRSDLWMRDEAASGRPALSAELLAGWLDR